MRTRKIYLTSQEKAVTVRDSNNGKYGVGGVNWQWFPFWAGVVLAIALPFLLDFAMFGTPFPCETIKTFEDGSSVQKCSVRN